MSARFVLTVAGAVCLTLPAFAQSEAWKIDPPHSAAQFAVRHMGISTVRGSFAKVMGDVQYDASNVGKSSMEVSIDANSIDTRVDMRDNDLRGAKYFDVAKYPTITFKSRRIESAGAGKLKVDGDLTIHGVTKEVMLDVDGPSEPVKDPRGKVHMGATATTQVNRMDFGVSGGSGMVGNDISITLDVELVKASPATP